ncbi:MAG TPA: Asp23/Gls24 family envelope stress response protein [Fusobacteria bacterium]|nr:Asp23/Gls24 family envelope stress response protein [Fusobacteriota bacterium]|tara:strand:+ start:8181 stop:8570 length:390 start_codon:yes stop_codon:yes gene_type:complete
MSNTGEIKITNDVVSSIAGAATMRVDGVYELSGGVVEGISEMLGKKQFQKGIYVKIDDDKHRVIDINIAVKHGYKVGEVARKIQHNVKKDIKDMLDIKIHSVNVYVDKVRIEPSEEGAPSDGEKGKKEK